MSLLVPKEMLPFSLVQPLPRNLILLPSLTDAYGRHGKKKCTEVGTLPEDAHVDGDVFLLSNSSKIELGPCLARPDQIRRRELRLDNRETLSQWGLE